MSRSTCGCATGTWRYLTCQTRSTVSMSFRSPTSTWPLLASKPPKFFELVVEACREWRADLVVITGDLVEHDDVIAWIEPILSPLEARLGKFAILGNHDQTHQPETILDELARAGFQTLEGRWSTIVSDGAVLAIGGTSAPWGPAFEQLDIPTADFRLLLSHSPDLFHRAQDWDIDLMLSGHNHGGQIRFPAGWAGVHAQPLFLAGLIAGSSDKAER